jgi:hypothetical protein
MPNQTRKEKAILELQEVLADAQEKAYALAEVVGFTGESGDDDDDEDFDPDMDESPVSELIAVIGQARQQLIVIKRKK